MSGVNRPLTRRTGPRLAYIEPIALLRVDVPTALVPVTTGPVWVNQRGTAALILAGRYSLESTVTGQALAGADLTGTKLALEAFGGATATIALPTLLLSATGEVQVTGRLTATLPALTLIASGTAGGTAQATLSLSEDYPLTALGGGQMRGSLTSAYMLVGGGTSGGIASAVMTLPALQIDAHAVTESVGRAEITLPALTTAPSGQAWLVGPRLSLHAVAHEVVAVSYEAYAINLTTGVVTHYTNYPFDNILRFGNKFYGVASTGLFEIGGALDVTTTIDAHIKTFATKLGSGQMKRVPYIYSSGRSDGGALVGITPDEGETYEYESDWGEIPGSTNHRTQIGKGVRGVYYSFDISNIDGSSLELDSITAEPAVSQRGI